MPSDITQFKKGKSGNPGGRPKMPDDLREYVRAHTPEAIKILIEVMNDKDAPPASRVTASTAILDRGWGRPGQAIKVVGEVIDANKPVPAGDALEGIMKKLFKDDYIPPVFDVTPINTNGVVARTDSDKK